MSKKVLLIAFKYPPYAGVGGFRWSKFSKYLAEMGYTVHVVTVKWKQYGDNVFLNDVQHPNIIIHRIPSLYFHNYRYRKYGKNFVGNLQHLCRGAFFKLMNLIWYDDEAQFWGYALLPFCTNLIEEEDIKNVIATGHPFMANYWAAKLKEKLPSINLLQDIRDPWNDDPLKPYPFAFQSKRSVQREIYSFNTCDTFITVSDGLMELLENKIHSDVRKVMIPNGFDMKPSGSSLQEPLKRDFSFIYAGNLFCGREEPLDSLLKAVENLGDRIPEIKLNFYGSFPLAFKNKYSKLFKKGIISYHSPVSSKKIQSLMYESFVCLQLNARIYCYARSTKIYEHAFLRRPTLSVNYGGEIDSLIKVHKLGVSVNGDDNDIIEKELLRFYEIWKNDPCYQINPESLEQYNYSCLTKKLIEYFT